MKIERKWITLHVYQMKIIYDYMRKKHPFITSSDDYCNIALIAIHSKFR